MKGKFESILVIIYLYTKCYLVIIAGLHDLESEAATASAQNKKRSKKRAASDPDLETTRTGEHFMFKENLIN